MRKSLLAAVSAVALTFGTAGFAGSAGAQTDAPGTIVEVAQGNPDFSTLVTAVSAAGLVETLSGDGPFTVFAPTNAAFEALPAGTLDKLLADPKGALTDVLKLHVIAGSVDSKAATAAAGTNVDTLGGPVAVALDGDKLTVGGATVVTADIKASNGIIHVIDAVITAPAQAGEAADSGEAADAAGSGDAEASDATPTRVETGTDGLAAESGRNGLLLALLAGAALVGISGSSAVLVRNRRKS